MRNLVTICAIILGTVSCSTCWTTPGAGIVAGPNTVGFGNRAGAPNYFCPPGVCQSTGINDPDHSVCLGGYKRPTGAAANSAQTPLLAGRRPDDT